MRRTRQALIAMTAALAVVAAPAVATAAPTMPDRAGLQNRLDDIVAAGSIGALAEVRDGARVWRGASGVAERDKSRPVPTNGRFRAGSITKTFVAAVVLQLVDAGELRLDDSVEAWLPGVVPNGRQITVRHLLNNTSGLADVVKTLPMPPRQEFYDNRWRTWSADELLRRALARPPAFEPPGSVYGYSNTNYILLGRIIEQATKQSYSHEIERRIIRPLGLEGTSLPGTSPRIHGPHPHGYVPGQRPGELVDYTEMNPSVFGAGGELISTTKDLNRFFAALFSGRLLPNHLLHEMRKPGIEGSTYGLGLRKRTTSCGVNAYGNDGDALAYQSWSFTTEDRRKQVTVALTPTFAGDPDKAVDAFLNRALCG